MLNFNPSIALCLALLIDVSLTKASKTTKSSSLPTLQSGSQSSSAAQGTSTSSHTSSSYHATFTPVVPSATDNKYIYHERQRSGTVFIAVGSCLGFIIVCTVVVWLFFGLRAWRSARREYRLKEVENKYQYDPYFFAGASDRLDNSTDYSDTDDGTDISEKVIKTRSPRLSTYSLGSNSALNLLQQQPPHASDAVVDPNAAFFNASNMFISPTEVLKNHGQNASNLNLVAPPLPPSSESNGSSTTSTPREQVFATIIDNPSSSTLPQVMKSTYFNSSRSSISGLPLYNSTLNDSSAHLTGKRGKDYRPPSAHLETLLDRNL
ncbi:ZYBA0S04-03972g1_1 [Zygosaccharomyces bailii CLIB 213]|uniref:ZYBA0S04-03972g1_1 n=1 Tax=Zygosaccharomyces bailii (strain CLIB 213 / ATCC 58445 / CBS 680 / BCRC 21525 / NBRC 1098 / NCYC 1416 / NRRL Y-2227) TaxID=1333698 RepID=A0A8J2T6K3_ZYGB2|nr:ZYBA0S04-03972g1_1 [Zygosaccharomyces bailii CLIB 213]